MSNEKLTAVLVGKYSKRRALLYASPFMLLGVVAAVLELYGLATGQLDSKASQHLLTVIVACIGFPMLIIGWFATKRPQAAVQLKASNPEKPWKWREDWAAGRVDNSVIRSIFFVWVAVVFFNLICLLAMVIMLNWTRFGNHFGWFGLIFPFAGLAVLVFAVKTTRAWGNFGRSTLVAATLPVAPGGVLTGEIRVPARLQPEHAFYLRLSCIRRTASQRGKTRVTTERILWQDEKWFRPSLPQPVPGATCIPVFFQLPADLPESTLASEEGVQFRLEAHAKVPGPDFHGQFEVPVFKPEPTPLATAPTAAASGPTTAPAPVADPTLPHQLTLDEVRKEIRSRIQILDLPDGREFIFPAGRIFGFAAMAAALWLIWTMAVILMALMHAPLLFPLVFAVVDVIMGIFLCDLWFRRSSVLVTPAQVKIRTSWLTLKKELVLVPGEIASIKADIGATAGHTAYYDLRIRTRKGKDLVAAKFLNHKPEADWLIRQMVAVLKRS